LKSKYSTDTIESPGAIIISGKQVEEVGFEKIKKLQSRLNELKIVYLDGLLISQPINAQRAQEIVNTCPKISTLDLARNLLESIEEVAYICQYLSQLRELRLK
jgi:hypothetical protein